MRELFMLKKQAFNPILPSDEYIPDVETYVFGNRVYLYGSHDCFNGGNFCEKDYVCWSAPKDDLGNWNFEGVIYEKNKDPLFLKNGEFLYAPDVALGVDGRYYLFYSFDLSGVISVAVCDSPAGKYEFYGHVHYPDGTVLGSKEGDPFQFNPCVLIDNDGRIYLYSGFCPLSEMWDYIGRSAPIVKGAIVTEVKKDMLTVKKNPKIIVPWYGNSEKTSFEEHPFFEASSIKKIDEKYYFIYSSMSGHELCCGVSDHPDKGFVFGGVIISNGDVGFEERSEEEAMNYTGNNHGSIVNIDGQWYIFYHRHTNRNQFSRQACAEKIYIKSDGNIDQVEITSCGLNDGPLHGKGEYGAYIACDLMSKKGAADYMFCSEVPEFHPFFTQEEGKQYIANMMDGAVAGFKYFEFEDVSKITVAVRGSGNGVIFLGTEPGEKDAGYIKVKPSKEWESFSGKIKLENGVKPLFFEYKGKGYVDFLKFIID